MDNGFVRVAAANIDIKLADPAYNAKRIQDAARGAASKGADIVLFQELCLTGCTCGDLFLDDKLLSEAKNQLLELVSNSSGRPELVVVGLPLVYQNKIYNTAAVYSDGSLHGIVPKSSLQSDSENSEHRYFASGKDISSYISLPDISYDPDDEDDEDDDDELDISFGFIDDLSSFGEIPFSANILFKCDEDPEFCFAVEIGCDLMSACPPSQRSAMAGALLILNPYAGAEAVGMSDHRRQAIRAQSERLICGYVQTNASRSESTTDMVFSGHCVIAESGMILAENDLFDGPKIVISDIDTRSLLRDRRVYSVFESIGAYDFDFEEVSFSIPKSNGREDVDNVIPFDRSEKENKRKIFRPVDPYPFLPDDDKLKADYCEQILTMQAVALSRRIIHTGSKCALIGISGGLDSSLALIATQRAVKLAGKGTSIMAVTMPGFGTSKQTKDNASRLCKALGIELSEINIEDNVSEHLKTIGHNKDEHDVVYENAQARIRTLVLMDLANKNSGIMVGTGDMSELALGWTTYAGDHMSMYGINAGVPKTLVKYVLEYIAEMAEKDNAELKDVLTDIIKSPISPELLPPDSAGISQKTEEIIGPFELHDFFLYHMMRHGRSPEVILELAQIAFPKYDPAVIKSCLITFYRRFFKYQFKRSALPDGPMVLDISLSPRGSWHMPSDAEADIWLDELT